MKACFSNSAAHMRNECEATSMARSLSGGVPPTIYGGMGRTQPFRRSSEPTSHNSLSRHTTQAILHDFGTASYLDNISHFDAARLGKNCKKCLYPLTYRSASCAI